MTSIPPNYEPSEKKKITDQIIFDIQTYLSKWLQENYPDFGKKWSELHQNAVNETEKLRQTVIGLKKGYESDYVHRFDDFKKELNQILSKEHPLFDKIEKLSNDMDALTKSCKVQQAEINNLTTEATSVVDEIKDKANLFTTICAKLTSSSSLYQDIYETRDRIETVSKQLAKFRFAFEKMFEEEKEPENLSQSIRELEFSARTTNCLENAGITTVKELMDVSDAQLLRYRNFGRKSLEEIQKFRKKLGKNYENTNSVH